VADPPGLTVALAGLALREKSAAAALVETLNTDLPPSPEKAVIMKK